MTLEQFNQIGEIVAAFGVIASLIFLAVQTRQNSRTMRAKAAWDAQTSFVEINDELSSGSRISEISFKVFTDPASLTPFERYLFHRFMRGVMQRTEAQYALYTNGVLGAEVWRLRRGYIKSLMNNAYMSDFWQAEKANSMFTRAFVAEIDKTDAQESPTFLGMPAPPPTETSLAAHTSTSSILSPSQPQ